MKVERAKVLNYVRIVKEEKRDLAATYKGLQRGLGIQHPERILGFVGLFFDTGNVYASGELASDMSKSPRFGAFILEILRRFSKEDYGDISENDFQDNGEVRWLGGGGRLYGRYACGKSSWHEDRVSSYICVRQHQGYMWVTYESEPDWFLFLQDEEVESLQDWSGMIREGALWSLESKTEPEKDPEDEKGNAAEDEEDKPYDWRICAVGWIADEYTDEYGMVWHGTDTFKPGTEVYVRGKNYDGKSPGIQVLGLNRFGHLELDTVAVGQLTYVRPKRIMKREVLDFMNHPGFRSGWWGRRMEACKEIRAFNSVLNNVQKKGPAFCSVDPTFSEKYSIACADRDVPDTLLALQRVLWMGAAKSKRRAMKEEWAITLMEDYPFKTEAELKYREALREKKIDERNWLRHLDEMTDREITFMLEQQPGKNGLDLNRRAHPEISDRIRAEFMRDL